MESQPETTEEDPSPEESRSMGQSARHESHRRGVTVLVSASTLKRQTVADETGVRIRLHQFFTTGDSSNRMASLDLDEAGGRRTASNDDSGPTEDSVAARPSAPIAVEA